MDANKLIMMGYKLKIEHMGYSVYLNINTSKLIVINKEQVVFKQENVGIVCKRENSDKNFIIYGTNERMSKTTFKIAIDSKGSLLVCKDTRLDFWHFFFYETKEVWLAREGRTLYYFDKTANLKYKLKLDYKDNRRTTDNFYIKKIANGVLLLGNTLINFNSGNDYDMVGRYILGLDKIVIQEVDHFGFINRVVYSIRLSDGKLFRGYGFPETKEVLMQEVENGTETDIVTASDLIQNDKGLEEIHWLTNLKGE